MHLDDFSCLLFPSRPMHIKTFSALSCPGLHFLCLFFHRGLCRSRNLLFLCLDACFASTPPPIHPPTHPPTLYISEDRTFKVWDLGARCLLYKSAIVSASPLLSLALDARLARAAIGAVPDCSVSRVTGAVWVWGVVTNWLNGSEAGLDGGNTIFGEKRKLFVSKKTKFESRAPPFEDDIQCLSVPCYFFHPDSFRIFRLTRHFSSRRTLV